MFEHRVIGKREADADALHGTTSTTLYNTRISKPVKTVCLLLFFLYMWNGQLARRGDFWSRLATLTASQCRWSSARTSPTPTRGMLPAPSAIPLSTATKSRWAFNLNRLPMLNYDLQDDDWLNIKLSTSIKCSSMILLPVCFNICFQKKFSNLFWKLFCLLMVTMVTMVMVMMMMMMIAGWFLFWFRIAQRPSPRCVSRPTPTATPRYTVKDIKNIICKNHFTTPHHGTENM